MTEQNEVEELIKVICQWQRPSGGRMAGKNSNLAEHIIKSGFRKSSPALVPLDEKEVNKCLYEAWDKYKYDKKNDVWFYMAKIICSKFGSSAVTEEGLKNVLISIACEHNKHYESQYQKAHETIRIEGDLNDIAKAIMQRIKQ